MPDAVTLCDGCKEPIENCICDELAAEHDAECGKYCHECGCDGCSDYMYCLLRHLYAPGDCPRLTGVW